MSLIGKRIEKGEMTTHCNVIITGAILELTFAVKYEAGGMGLQPPHTKP